jgi:hypothetical protein
MEDIFMKKIMFIPAKNSLRSGGKLKVAASIEYLG